MARRRPQEHGLVLYGRQGCHLCEEMKAVVLPLCSRFDVTLQEIDILTDPELERRYAIHVPVLVMGSREIARHRMRDAEMSRLIEALTSQADSTRRIR